MATSTEVINQTAQQTLKWFSRFSYENQNTNKMLENTTCQTDFNSLGNKLFKERKFEEAAQYYTKVLAENPKDTVSLRNRSYSYMQLKRWDLALADARKALELDPDDLKGLFILGLVWLSLENFEEAIQNLQKARELAKWQYEFCDTAEIVSTLWSARRKQRLKQKEEERIQKAELHSLLEKLIREDTFRKTEELFAENESKEVDEKLGDKIITLDSEYDKHMSMLTSIFVDVDKKQNAPEIPNYFCDRITLEIMKEPVITRSGITYERAAIIKHFEKVGLFDPSTRKEMLVDELIPNNAIEAAINAFLEENEWLLEDEE